jgi:hypothetical protein
MEGEAMKHKKLVIITVIVVVAMAIAASAAYALFTSSASTDPYTVSTGTANITLGLAGPQWSLASLVPASGPASSDARSETITVNNSGQTSLDMQLTATYNNVQASDGSYLSQVLDLQVVGPHGTWIGHLGDLGSLDLGAWGLGTANVTLTVWLDAAAGNPWQGWAGTPITFNFNGTQIVQ